MKAIYDDRGRPDEDEFSHSLGMLSEAGFNGPMSLIFDTPLHGDSTEWDNLAQLRMVAASFCD